MISLRFRPEFSDEWSSALLQGDDAAAAANILVARLLRLDYEVEAAAEGEWVEYCELEGDEDA